jgi:hypothetical protein
LIFVSLKEINLIIFVKNNDMTTLNVRPRNKKEYNTFSKILKALNADFEVEERNNIINNQELIEKIKLSHKQKEAGTLKTINPKEIWKSIGL